MSTPHGKTADDASVHREYVLGVRIVEQSTPEGDGCRYRFQAPDHGWETFADPERAELYADVYFDVNGFVEEGTGDRGVPPELIQAGKDTLAAYLLTRPGADVGWVASFYGRKPGKIEGYVSWVRNRAEEIRRNVAAREDL